MTAPLELAFFGGGQSGLPPCYFHLVVVVWSYPEHSYKLIEPQDYRNYFETIYFTYPLACGGYMGDYQGVGGHK